MASKLGLDFLKWPQELTLSLSLFILIFVDQCLDILLKVLVISSRLLMTIAATLWFIYYNVSPKPLLNLKNIIYLWKIRLIITYKSFILIMGLSIRPMHFNTSVLIMVSSINSLLPTHPNKMVWPKERTDHWLKRLHVCSKPLFSLLAFCSEAIMIANHIQKCLTSKSLISKTPLELWIGRWPTIHYFWTFGCNAFVHQLHQKTKKFESKSTKCIFVGYSSFIKGYRLYNPSTKKILISRDVILNEQLPSSFSSPYYP